MQRLLMRSLVKRRTALVHKRWLSDTRSSKNSSTSRGNGAAKVMDMEEKSSSGFGKVVFGVIFLTPPAITLFAHYVINFPNPPALKEQVIAASQKYPGFYDIVKTDGSLNKLLKVGTEKAGVEKHKETKIEKKESVKRSESSSSTFSNYIYKEPFVFEDGKTAADWEEIKDQIIICQTRLDEVDLETERAKLTSRYKKAPSKVETATSVKTSDGDSLSSPTLTSEKKGLGESEVSEERALPSDKIREKIRAIGQKELEKAFDVLDGEKGEAEFFKTAKAIEARVGVDLETVLVQDLKLVSEEELKKRMVKLVLELKERSRWEALRLVEALEIENKRTKHKTETLLARQEQLYESLIDTASREADVKAREETRREMEQDYEKKQAEFEQKVKDKFRQLLQEQRRNLEKAMNNRVQKHEKELFEEKEMLISDFRKQIMEAEEKTSLAEGELNSLKQAFLTHQEAHGFAGTAISLFESALSGRPFSDELAAFKTVAPHISSDAPLSETLSKFPESVAQNGLRREEDIVEEFKQVSKDVAKNILVPAKDPSLLNHALASVVAKLTLDLPRTSTQGVKPTDEEVLEIAKAKILKDHDVSGGLDVLKELSEKNQPKLFMERALAEQEARRILSSLKEYSTTLMQNLSKQKEDLQGN